MAGGLTVVTRRLRPRPPFAAAPLLEFLALRAVPGVEAVAGTTYARTLRLAGGPATLELDIGARSVAVSARVTAARDADAAITAARRIVDAGADPVAIDAALGADALLAPLVAARPGLRAPGTADGAEVLVRAITGQQVSVAGARTTLGRIVLEHGEPLPRALQAATAPDGGPRCESPGADEHSADSTAARLTHTFPSPRALAGADPAALGMPRARGAAIVAASAACADGLRLEPGADRDATRAALLALPGVGPWTAAYVAMRALADPDAFMPTDLGVRHALAALGATDDVSERWRPYRSYVVHHLWASLTSV